MFLLVSCSFHGFILLSTLVFSFVCIFDREIAKTCVEDAKNLECGDKKLIADPDHECAECNAEECCVGTLYVCRWSRVLVGTTEGLWCVWDEFFRKEFVYLF